MGSPDTTLSMLVSHSHLLVAVLCSLSYGVRSTTRTVQTQLPSGEFVQYEEFDITESDECYQFTWIGLSEEDNLGNNTESFPTCLDLENDFVSKYGREIPCFPPLVRTYNDETGMNSPNVTQIGRLGQKIRIAKYIIISSK